ncbi:hypothetical protein PIB30_079158 [Stylosanthes scabra]|uniref:Uncharacterized protein n=1 Tax=Stylosanthes scabra TaxID=79078 RepID=A0ABU6XS06_9FABA|nr:hypothetical protein [Stylosanthes scabra]
MPPDGHKELTLRVKYIQQPPYSSNPNRHTAIALSLHLLATSPRRSSLSASHTLGGIMSSPTGQQLFVTSVKPSSSHCAVALSGSLYLLILKFSRSVAALSLTGTARSVTSPVFSGEPSSQLSSTTSIRRSFFPFWPLCRRCYVLCSMLCVLLSIFVTFLTSCVESAIAIFTS